METFEFQNFLVNPNNLNTISEIERATMGIWDKDNQNFTNQNELHNK